MKSDTIESTGTKETSPRPLSEEASLFRDRQGYTFEANGTLYTDNGDTTLRDVIAGYKDRLEERGIKTKDVLIGLLATLLRRKEKELKTMQGEREYLEKVIGTDLLTGLNNRLNLDDRLKKLIGKFNRNNNHPEGILEQVGIIVFELDLKGLKAFNLKGVKTGGDAALRSFAELLRTHVRDHDLLFRVGGDEFIMILPIENLATGGDLEKIFEKVVQNMKDLLGDKAYLGHSIRRNNENTTPEEILIAADKDMTDNKNQEKGEKWLVGLSINTKGLEAIKIVLDREVKLDSDTIDYYLQSVNGEHIHKISLLKEGNNQQGEFEKSISEFLKSRENK